MMLDINTKLTNCNNEDCLHNIKRNLQSVISKCNVTAYEKYPTMYSHTLKVTVKVVPNTLHKKTIVFLLYQEEKQINMSLITIY